MRNSSIRLLFLCMVLLTACAPNSVPGATTTSESPLEISTEMVPTPAPTETPAVRPPDQTNTPGPAALNPEGPYVLFEGYGGIWITNPDGSFPTRISDIGFNNPFLDPHRAISPDGERLALIRSTDSGADLLIVHLPDGETDLVARLVDRATMEQQTSTLGLAWHAVTRYDNVAWQPGEGRLLAFIGAMDGPTADLYVYDTLTKETTRLTSGPSQALFPNWSPDGEYILHFGGSWVPPLGGALNEYSRPDGAWAVRIADGGVITQPGKSYRHSNFLGWLDDGHYVISDNDEECNRKNLRTVAVADGTTAAIFEGCYFSYDAFSPENGAVLLSSQECDRCPLGEGTFLLLPGETVPRRIWDERAWEIDWRPESGVFDVYPHGAVSADGQRFDPPAPEPSDVAVSMQGWVAWLELVDQAHQVAVGRPGEEPTILEIALGAMIWDPVDGSTLLGVSGGTVYAATAPDFSLRTMGELGDGADQAIWLP
jgi:hypothetical protein